MGHTFGATERRRRASISHSAEQGATHMSDFLDKAKEKAAELKDKAEGLVDQVADKLPDSVTDKIEKIIPGDRDGDGN
jgi:hypothetical protein